MRRQSQGGGGRRDDGARRSRVTAAGRVVPRVARRRCASAHSALRPRRGYGAPRSKSSWVSRDDGSLVDLRHGLEHEAVLDVDERDVARLELRIDEHGLPRALRRLRIRGGLGVVALAEQHGHLPRHETRSACQRAAMRVRPRGMSRMTQARGRALPTHHCAGSLSAYVQSSVNSACPLTPGKLPNGEEIRDHSILSLFWFPSSPARDCHAPRAGV